MFRDRYVPRVERERLAQEFLDLRQGTKSVTKITRMFTERAVFRREFASEKVQMSRYLRMLKRDIKHFFPSSVMIHCWSCRRPPGGMKLR